MEFILQILNWLNSVTQVEYVCMAKFKPVDKHDFDNWLLDSGASAHMTPHREDLEKQEKCNIIVTLADGSEIRCREQGICKIKIIDDDQKQRTLRLDRVLVVEGLNRRLFSVDSFRKTKGNGVLFHHDKVQLRIAGWIHKTLSYGTLKESANEVQEDRHITSYVKDARKKVSCKILHKRLGHSSNSTILYASKFKLWQDVYAQST